MIQCSRPGTTCGIGLARRPLAWVPGLLRWCRVWDLGLPFENWTIGMAEDNLVCGFSLGSSYWSPALASTKRVPQMIKLPLHTHFLFGMIGSLGKIKLLMSHNYFALLLLSSHWKDAVILTLKGSVLNTDIIIHSHLYLKFQEILCTLFLFAFSRHSFSMLLWRLYWN